MEYLSRFDYDIQYVKGSSNNGGKKTKDEVLATNESEGSKRETRTCFHCQKKGHIARYCRSKAKEKEKDSPAPEKPKESVNSVVEAADAKLQWKGYISRDGRESGSCERR